ncbi:unnamed protein product [Ixodes pacificus]
MDEHGGLSLGRDGGKVVSPRVPRHLHHAVAVHDPQTLPPGEELWRGGRRLLPVHHRRLACKWRSSILFYERLIVPSAVVAPLGHSQLLRRMEIRRPKISLIKL